jgi:hypothetical protein
MSCKKNREEALRWLDTGKVDLEAAAETCKSFVLLEILTGFRVWQAGDKKLVLLKKIVVF